MQFTKMHGLGNDFIILDNRDENISGYATLAEKLCRRRFSTGADGIILIMKSNQADIKMRIFNSDGSEAQMCGNGIRCFAHYVYKNNIIATKKMTVETLAGIITPEIVDFIDNKTSLVRVDMGKPRLSRHEIPMLGEDAPQVVGEPIEAGGVKFTFTAVSMGNPHCIIFVDEITDEMVRRYGPIIEKHPIFPEKTNVEFIRVLSPEHIQFRVWERGAGETLACGTGACASVVAGIIKGLLERKVKVSLPGGDLTIEWEENGNVIMTGAAEEVFRGTTA